MKRVVNISKNHQQALEWDIKQALSMTPEERREVAAKLKKKVYGTDNPDVREWHRKNDEAG